MNTPSVQVGVFTWSPMRGLKRACAAVLTGAVAAVIPLQAIAQVTQPATSTPVTRGEPVVPHKVKGDPAKLMPSGPQTGRTAVSEGEPLPTWT